MAIAVVSEISETSSDSGLIYLLRSLSEQRTCEKDESIATEKSMQIFSPT